jgi:hypothetical protein
VVLTCGTHGAGIRILVPLTASDAILDEGLAILTEALVDAKVPPDERSPSTNPTCCAMPPSWPAPG